ncbi:MAG TPA: xanthine dehydrogenase accessory protein XdhC [Acetobacteraceae bacterium]|nr:xanthine dehydrogenase accessory protein XdhC [Acetobacteraceae bacterium]
MTSWIEALAALERAGEDAVLVTVLVARGSTPREAGAKMVVTATGQHGSIGGGRLELTACGIARDLLRDGATLPEQRAFPLGPALGQCCGGHATLLFEPVRHAAMHIALFGAGHVGQALVRLFGDLPCRVAWIDSRAEAFPAEIPGNVTATTAARPETLVAGLRPGTRLLVMTHDHALDYAIVAAALAQNGLDFIGLIGSRTKRARFVSRLSRAGISTESLARLECPVGVPGVGGKLPAEIAISIAARVLQTRAEGRQTARPEQGTESVQPLEVLRVSERNLPHEVPGASAGSHAEVGSCVPDCSCGVRHG